MADRGLDAHIGSTGDVVLDAHRLLADLSVLALDAPLSQRAAVVVLDDDTAADRAFLGALLGGLDQQARAGAAPLLRTASVDEVLTDVEPAGSEGGADASDPLVRTVVSGEPSSSVSALRDDLAAARADVSSYRSVFGDEDPLAADVDELILTAGASSLSDAERDSMLGGARGQMRNVLSGIHGPARQRVTLTAREGQVQFVLGNETGRPADVVLELRGDRFEFPDYPDGQVPVTLEDETTRVDLEVRARSSGDAPLDLRIVSPDGRVQVGQSRITVRTTAVSGVGLVLMGAAATFLVVWWTRTIVRERRGSRRRHPAHAGR
jgi:hypothetical protein